MQHVVANANSVGQPPDNDQEVASTEAPLEMGYNYCNTFANYPGFRLACVL